MKRLLYLVAYSFVISATCLPKTATEELFDYLDQIKEANATMSVTVVRQRLEELVNRGAQINSHNKNNVTPLMLAAEGHIEHAEEIVEFLVANGANVNARDHHRSTVLNHALYSHDPKIVSKLMQHGAKVAVHHLSSALGFPEVFEVLLLHCKNLQERYYSGDSLLHQAVISSYKETKLLLEHNVDVHIKNTENGRSILHSVFSPHMVSRSINETDEDRLKELEEKKSIVRYLLERGLPLNVEDNNGATPLHALIKGDLLEKNRKLPLLEFLIQRGADPLKKDHNGLSPLHYAMHANDSDIINAFRDAIKRYQPMNIDAAEAELVDDIEQVKAVRKKRNLIKTVGSYVSAFGLNGLALYGAVKGIMMLRKVKLH